MPIKTPVRSRFNGAISSNASRLVCKIANCCGKVCAISRGGKRKPSVLTPMLDIRPSPRVSSKLRPLRSTSRKASRLPALATIVPRPTIARVTGLLFGAESTSVGSSSETIRCALLPPKPKAEIAAMRGSLLGQFSSSCSTRNGRSSNAGFGIDACKVGGRWPACMASSNLIKPAAPAVVIKWPRLDLSEPIGTGFAPAKTVPVLANSVASPTGVPVAWHSSKPMRSGPNPAEAYAARMARC